MSAYIDALLARRTEIYTTLNSMTIASVGGKPNLLTKDGGHAVDHIKFRLSLYEELEKIDKLIIAADAVQDAIDGTAGSYEIVTILSPSYGS